VRLFDDQDAEIVTPGETGRIFVSNENGDGRLTPAATARRCSTA